MIQWRDVKLNACGIPWFIIIIYSVLASCPYWGTRYSIFVSALELLLIQFNPKDSRNVLILALDWLFYSLPISPGASDRRRKSEHLTSLLYHIIIYMSSPVRSWFPYLIIAASFMLNFKSMKDAALTGRISWIGQMSGCHDECRMKQIASFL